jgi:cell fate (sporulation/competence/biofilm development) regulator YlbF (YheA/YmcA/DUF963 family)
MAREISDELLVALADGELPEAEAEGLLADIENDPEAKARFDAFVQSGNALMAMFQHSSLQATPSHIAEKIRNIGQEPPAGAAVIDFDDFKRQRKSRTPRAFSFQSLQRYAAVLFVGGVLGAVGASEFGRQFIQTGSAPQQDELVFRGTDQLHRLPGGTAQLDGTKFERNDDIFERREPLRPILRQLGGLRDAVYLVDQLGKHYQIGSFVPKDGTFKLSVTLPHDGMVSISYKEGAEPLKIIVGETSVKANDEIIFPTGDLDFLKFETNEPLISFIIRLESEKLNEELVVSFGLNATR